MIQNPVLSIAGFDNSGGAGLQADLKVFSAFGCYGMTVVTAIAVQNTTGVKQCHMIDTNIIQAQLETIFDDIQPKAVKFGMLFNESIIDTIYNFFITNNIKIPIIIDPVMMAKSGDPLLLPEARQAMIDKLIPLATVLTPNLPEALELIKEDPKDINKFSQEEITHRILKLGCHSVLVKGGHYNTTTSPDLLSIKGEKTQLFDTERISSPHTHGTGCTLSAAITSLIAQNFSIQDSVHYAKKYLTKAIQSGITQNVGKGCGPTDHFWFLDQACGGLLHENHM